MLHRPDRCRRSRPARALRRFLHDESGVMTPHVLIFFVLMLLLGGIAVDVMRFETRRVAVQNTMDRATLAAAALKQSLLPVTVVNDWFAKTGLGQELESVNVSSGMNYKIVTALARVQSKNFFMSMMGTPYLAANNRSQAEQRVTNVEIALVLDVSGSMYNQSSRITNLKTAAKQFIDTVIGGDTENKISIAIVPYNGQVNLGPVLFSKFNATQTNSYANSHCLDLPTSTYSSTALSRATPFAQTPFADTWETTATKNAKSTSYVAIVPPTYDSTRKLYSNVWCQPVAGNFVRPFGNNRSTLKAQIDGLVAVGATSIDLGMKWGAFLLDPSSRSINAELAAAGQVPAYFAGRPADYSDRETLKVIVLMTDGENFEQERFNDGYRAGPSPVWKANDNYLSIFHATKVNSSTSTTICNSRPFWVPHLGAWHSRPWNGTTPSTSACYVPSTTSYASTTNLTWDKVWEGAHVQWVAWQLYARALGSTSTQRNQIFADQLEAIRGTVDTGTMDSRLATMCASAKANNVLVYGIAFEATTGGVNAIRSCVSEPKSNFFFDVAGLQISSAFAAIASNLSQLRLTQ